MASSFCYIIWHLKSLCLRNHICTALNTCQNVILSSKMEEPWMLHKMWYRHPKWKSHLSWNKRVRVKTKMKKSKKAKHQQWDKNNSLVTIAFQWHSTECHCKCCWVNSQDTANDNCKHDELLWWLPFFIITCWCHCYCFLVHRDSYSDSYSETLISVFPVYGCLCSWVRQWWVWQSLMRQSMCPRLHFRKLCHWN